MQMHDGGNEATGNHENEGYLVRISAVAHPGGQLAYFLHVQDIQWPQLHACGFVCNLTAHVGPCHHVPPVQEVAPIYEGGPENGR